jgi:MFS family permease
MNFKDGFAWGSFPVFFSHEHMLSDSHTDMLVALYPLCWGFAQAFTGALSDKFGRKLFLVTGTASCAFACAMYAVPGILWGTQGDFRHVSVWIFCDVLLGLGTALAYPALQAGAADEVDPVNRGVALGFYRFTRDMGYVVGAIVCGHLTDAVGYEWTFLVVALCMTASLLSMTFVYTPTFDPHDYEVLQDVTSTMPVYGSIRTTGVTTHSVTQPRGYVNKYSYSF